MRADAEAPRTVNMALALLAAWAALNALVVVGKEEPCDRALRAVAEYGQAVDHVPRPPLGDRRLGSKGWRSLRRRSARLRREDTPSPPSSSFSLSDRLPAAAASVSCWHRAPAARR